MVCVPRHSRQRSGSCCTGPRARMPRALSLLRSCVTATMRGPQRAGLVAAASPPLRTAPLPRRGMASTSAGTMAARAEVVGEGRRARQRRGGFRGWRALDVRAERDRRPSAYRMVRSDDAMWGEAAKRRANGRWDVPHLHARERDGVGACHCTCETRSRRAMGPRGARRRRRTRRAARAGRLRRAAARTSAPPAPCARSRAPGRRQPLGPPGG